MMRAALFLGLLLSLAVGVGGHGALVIPPPRNNHGNVDPAEIFRTKQFVPGVDAQGNGVLQHNGTGGGCCAGGACLWFSEGCFVGCETCTRLMPKGGNQIHTPPDCALSSEPTLPDEYRTYNAQGKSANGDWTRYHPWRSPGKAPTSDPCGAAGAYLHSAGPAGDKPAGAAHQGAPGSALPPLDGVTTELVQDGVAEVGWMLGANHGGGYLVSTHPLRFSFVFVSSRAAVCAVLALPEKREAQRGLLRRDAAALRDLQPHDPLPHRPAAGAADPGARRRRRHASGGLGLARQSGPASAANR